MLRIRQGTEFTPCDVANSCLRTPICAAVVALALLSTVRGQTNQPLGPQLPESTPRPQVAPTSTVDAPMGDPYRLTAQEKQRLGQILEYWEKQSGRVKTYSCEFERISYDPAFGGGSANVPKSQSVGIIRYAAPDKGEFKVNTVRQLVAPPAAGQQPQYEVVDSDYSEHWICDGKSVFNLNSKTKQLMEERLPPELQGKGIADGPLPFLFGAKKEKLLARYWMKELVPPTERVGEYWIEAQPKYREDAANFQRILVILDEKEFLPTAMQLFPPEFDARKNVKKDTYVFRGRKVNDPLQQGREFFGQFISPTVPLGWKKVVVNYGQPAQPPAATDQAQRPSDVR